MGRMSLSEMVTYSTVLIKCKYNNGTSGCGTGFIIGLCHNKETGDCIPALITNNHVVENSIETVFEFCRADANGNPLDTEPFTFRYSGIPWIKHPDKNVDLCCLPLGDALNHLDNTDTKIFILPLQTDMIPSTEQLNNLTAMEDVVMVGYPIGISDTYNHKPVIRRGITSTHPKKDYLGKKETLLDVSCYPGSSGSPVFILNQGAFSTPNGLNVGSRILLLGILYGGHELNARGVLQFVNLPSVPVPVTRIPINLGLMIKAERILEFEEIFMKSKEGNN